jgi:hypothetical protein
MKNAVFSDVTPCGSCKNRVLKERNASIIRVTRIGESHIVFLRNVRRFLVTGNVHSSPILVTLMMEALRSSETSVHARSTGRNVAKTAHFKHVQI